MEFHYGKEILSCPLQNSVTAMKFCYGTFMWETQSKFRRNMAAIQFVYDVMLSAVPYAYWISCACMCNIYCLFLNE